MEDRRYPPVGISAIILCEKNNNARYLMITNQGHIWIALALAGFYYFVILA